MRFEKMQGVDAVRDAALAQLKEQYQMICSGTDPETGKRIFVDCAVVGTTYRMDAGRSAAETHDAGVRLADAAGDETTFVVDFYNEAHYGVPIAVAKAIALQQAKDARQHYIQYQQLKQQLTGAQTVAQIRAIALTFDVNMEE